MSLIPPSLRQVAAVGVEAEAEAGAEAVMATATVAVTAVESGTVEGRGAPTQVGGLATTRVAKAKATALLLRRWAP